MFITLADSKPFGLFRFIFCASNIKLKHFMLCLIKFSSKFAYGQGKLTAQRSHMCFAA